MLNALNLITNENINEINVQKNNVKFYAPLVLKLKVKNVTVTRFLNSRFKTYDTMSILSTILIEV